MHIYLRAIGFSQIHTRTQVQELVFEIMKNAKTRKYTGTDDNTVYTEYTEEYMDNMGIIVRGNYEKENTYIYDHYFPYLKSNFISSYEDITIERNKDKESYAGICDDSRIGVSLIFYLQNVVDYIKIRNSDLLPVRGTSLNLTGLSIEGRIMMPIVKEKIKMEKAAVKRKELIDAAKKGDTNAIDSLTIDDMEVYTMLSEKIKKEDIYSLVNSYLMPYGVECDLYSILGEILDCKKLTNKKTEEKVWKLDLLCKDMHIEISINEIDLLGEPRVGRRFKGVVWMQGYINYPYNLI